MGSKITNLTQPNLTSCLKKISKKVKPVSIGVLMRPLAAEPRSTAGPLFLSQCPCGTILLILYSMVWDWRRVSRALTMRFNWPELLDPFLFSFFPFSSFCL